MSCRDFENDFELFVQGDLEGGRAEAIRAHLAGCPACEERRRAAERLVADLNASLATWAPPAGFAAAQASRRPGAARGRRPGLRAALLLAAAALVAVTVAVARKFPSPVGAPPALESASVVPSSGAKFAVLSPRRVRLDAGTLACSVRPSREPFSVETPAGVATALGTQFYISVQPVEDPSMNAKRLATAVVVATGTVQLVNGFGSAAAGRGERVYAEETSAPTRQVADLQARFGAAWKPVASGQKPSIPAYTLPLSPETLTNAARLAAQLQVDPKDRRLLANGFVVVPMPALRDEHGGTVKKDDLPGAYRGLREAGVPVFVTSDTLLHLFHVQFDEALKDVEEREFLPDVTALAGMLERRLGAQAAAAKDPVAREGLRKAWTFAAVGLAALRPDFAPAEPIRAEVERVAGLMKRHEGFWPDPGAAHEQWSLFRYAEDFSQYVPRGHYTRSEELGRYFTAMMWFGRMTFLLKGGDPHGPTEREPFLVSAEEAAAQTVAAAAMTRLLATETLADGRRAAEVWERIYAVTAYFAGLSDDLGLPHYAAALGQVLKATDDVAALADPGRMAAFRAELAKFRGPAIYGGTGGQTAGGESPDNLETALAKTAGFRLMGQRFVPDSYILGRLVFPAVGGASGRRTDMFTCVETAFGPVRGFPRGLDVLAVMGSARAREILAALGDDAYGRNPSGTDVTYDAALAGLRTEFAGLSQADWNRNLYWSWLYALQALLEPHRAGYPTFMTTDAWKDKSVTTALASWAQLRHDTILYAKQSYTEAKGEEAPPKPVPGYVEPCVEFYGRLLATVRMMKEGLGGMKALTPQASDRLDGLEKILVRLHAIAETELADRDLSEDDAAFVRDFADHLSGIRVRYPELEDEYRKAVDARDWDRASKIRERLDPSRSMSTALVADVHTDQNSGKVLEEATGHLDLAVVCIRRPDGSLTLAAGPVLSYYEFKHPMKDRLTDEAWREMLAKGRAPARPEWTSSYVNDGR